MEAFSSLTLHTTHLFDGFVQSVLKFWSVLPWFRVSCCDCGESVIRRPGHVGSSHTRRTFKALAVTDVRPERVLSAAELPQTHAADSSRYIVSRSDIAGNFTFRKVTRRGVQRFSLALLHFHRFSRFFWHNLVKKIQYRDNIFEKSMSFWEHCSLSQIYRHWFCANLPIILWFNVCKSFFS